MKQLLFLFLLPSLAMAQYQGNANQKITLGEQTTADGLVYRGVASIDTVTATSKITRANKQDTSAFLLLDTVTNLLWHYKTASNGWIQAGGGVSVSSFSAGTTGLTPSTATTGAVTLGGTLAVANGGTNTGTLTANKVMVGNGTSGVLTPTNLHWDNTNSRLGVGTGSPTSSLDVRGVINQQGAGNIDNKFESTSNTGRFIQSISNDVGAAFQQGVFGSNNSQTLFGKTATNIAFMYTTTFASTNPSVFVIGTYGNQDLLLGTNNNQRILIQSGGAVTINNLAGTNSRTVVADANGLLSAPTSSIMTKENVQVLNYGLNEILQFNPVAFDYIDKNKWGDERNLGFIVEDMYSIVPEVTGTMNNGDMYLDMVKLIPVLTKAIQEQQALIKALEQRIINLENK